MGRPSLLFIRLASLWQSQRRLGSENCGFDIASTGFQVALGWVCAVIPPPPEGVPISVLNTTSAAGGPRGSLGVPWHHSGAFLYP